MALSATQITEQSFPFLKQADTNDGLTTQQLELIQEIMRQTQEQHRLMQEEQQQLQQKQQQQQQQQQQQVLFILQGIS